LLSSWRGEISLLQWDDCLTKRSSVLKTGKNNSCVYHHAEHANTMTQKQQKQRFQCEIQRNFFLKIKKIMQGKEKTVDSKGENLPDAIEK
jgi:hypothetical protein